MARAKDENDPRGVIRYGNGDEVYEVALISDNRGVMFSDGRLTDGRRHCGRTVAKWLDSYGLACTDKTTPIFVD